MDIRISPTKQRTAEVFSDYLIGLMKTVDQLHIALSGGSTPKVVFEELVKRGLSADIWANVHFYWGDERLVPPSDADSNYKMTVDYLLSKIEIPKTNIHRIHGENNPEKEALRYSEVLKDSMPLHNGVPRFDLIILGMGSDGHTASIFPHEIKLWDASSYCAVATHPDSGQKRISITGNIINNAARIAFLITGDNKAPKLAEILDARGNYDTYPASLVEPTNGTLTWFLDEAAASELEA